MEAIQITTLSYTEFQNLLSKVAEAAASKAIAEVMAVKQDPNEELTVSALAGMFKCSKQTIYRRIKSHKISTVKIGRDVAIKRKWLETIKKPVVTNK